MNIIMKSMKFVSSTCKNRDIILSSEERQDVENMLKVNANKKMLQNFVMQKNEKKVVLKDVHDIHSGIKKIDKDRPKFTGSILIAIKSLRTERDHKTVGMFLKKPVNASDTESAEYKYQELLTPPTSYNSFVPDTLITEETKTFAISCQSTGSRPAALMYWFLEQQNITSNSTSQTIHDSPTDKYTVTSSLRYSVDRRYNEQKLKCGAVNIAGSMEIFLTLDVKCKLTL
ncbi:unnamed protein product [Mytilus edulis]|uniref:Ig-like domain-containing protein n=1 Tax=Mytilus edulis TaxID=6550 RepID=A0A8S3S7V6_MYTED|nr:unnamed protein product [Mytilus edulis]